MERVFSALLSPQRETVSVGVDNGDDQATKITQTPSRGAVVKAAQEASARAARLAGQRLRAGQSDYQERRSRSALPSPERLVIDGLIRCVRAFVATYAVKGTLEAVVTLLRKRRWKPVLRALFSRDSLQFATFVGGMVLLTSLGRAAMIKLRRKDDRWTSAAAGALGALAILLDTPARRQSLALYILVRAIYAGLHTIMRRQYISRIPYFAHMLFVVANIPILTALIWGDRSLLDAGYLRWILNMANLDRHAIDWTIVEPAMGLDLQGISDAIGIASAVAAHTGAPPSLPPSSTAHAQSHRELNEPNGTPRFTSDTKKAAVGETPPGSTDSMVHGDSRISGDEGPNYSAQTAEDPADDPLDYMSGINHYTEDSPGEASGDPTRGLRGALRDRGSKPSQRGTGAAGQGIGGMSGASLGTEQEGAGKGMHSNGANSQSTRSSTSSVALHLQSDARLASGTSWMAQKGIASADAPRCKVESSAVSRRYGLAVAGGKAAIEGRTSACRGSGLRSNKLHPDGEDGGLAPTKKRSGFFPSSWEPVLAAIGLKSRAQQQGLTLAESAMLHSFRPEARHFSGSNALKPRRPLADPTPTGLRTDDSNPPNGFKVTRESHAIAPLSPGIRDALIKRGVAASVLDSLGGSGAVKLHSHGSHAMSCSCTPAARVQEALQRGAHPTDILPGVQVGPQFFRSCDIAWHRGSSCLMGNIKEIPALAGKSFRVYAPVHLIPLLLFRGKMFLQDPVRTVLRTSLAILRSTGFLTFYVTFVKMTICGMRQARGQDAWWHCALAALTSGVPLLLESDKRASELMLYCMPKGVEIVFQWLERRGWVSRLPLGDAIMFGSAMALALALNRSDFKGANAHLLDFLFGADQGRYYTDAEPDAKAPPPTGGPMAALVPLPISPDIAGDRALRNVDDEQHLEQGDPQMDATRNGESSSMVRSMQHEGGAADGGAPYQQTVVQGMGQKRVSWAPQVLVRGLQGYIAHYPVTASLILVRKGNASKI